MINQPHELQISQEEDESFDINQCDTCSKDDEASNLVHSKLENINNQYEKLQGSYIHIESEILMQYILFFIIGSYLLYCGVKYSDRTFLYIGIVLILYAATNMFMFFY